MEDTPLVALAPDASPPGELPPASPGVSASPDFHCLDEWLSLDQISQTKVATMTSSFTQLHDTLKSTQDSELLLLGEAKRCRAELGRLRAEVEGTEEQGTSEEPQSEVNQLRQQLLQAYGELSAAEDSEYETQQQLERLWEEKRYLEKENEIQPKPAELDSRTKALQDKQEDLRKEVSQRQMEVRNLTEDVEIHEMQIMKDQKELEEKEKIIEFNMAESAGLISAPDQILKEAEIKRTEKQATVKKTEAVKAQIPEMGAQLSEAKQRTHSLASENEELTNELQDSQASMEQVQVLSREEENRGILEMKLKHIMCDRKHLYESHLEQQRETNRLMETLKSMERAMTRAAGQLQHMQSIYNKIKLNPVSMRKAIIQLRLELQREESALKVNFDKQRSAAGGESQEKQQQQHRMIQGQLRDPNCLREELHNLRCLTQIKAEERGQKHRELLRAEQLNQHIQQELREKDLILMDHNKQNATLQRRLSQYCKLCHMITEEKNKYEEQRQADPQTITEMTEQLEVLENEMAIQRSIVTEKDRLLTKARMKMANSSKIRDKLRNDISKVVWRLREISQGCEDNEAEGMKLAQMIEQQEQATVEINNNIRTAIRGSDSLGIQLLEQKEVVLDCNEKVNVRVAAIDEGKEDVENMEKEMRDLLLEIKEETRQIELMKMEEALKKKLEGEVAMLQIELSEAGYETLETLIQTADYKELDVEDLLTEELLKEIEQLEEDLEKRDKQVKQKDLLMDQVTRLLEPSGKQVEMEQQGELDLTKKLNELRPIIIDIDNRLMAAAAELSMMRATALSLQQEIKERELQMDRCQQQLEQGLPPCPEVEEEWERMQRDEERRQRDKEEKARLAEEDEWHQLPNGVYTTAEARPNAYIPQTDPFLPLPKPYGALAPCKPPEPGANMRYIREPYSKPLEI